MNANQLILIAGPNGSGKTVGAFVLLPEFFQANEFVNADEIARGLSPLQPDSMNLRAGKLMLQRIKELLDSGKSFGVETTLAGRTYKFLVDWCYILDNSLSKQFNPEEIYIKNGEDSIILNQELWEKIHAQAK